MSVAAERGAGEEWRVGELVVRLVSRYDDAEHDALIVVVAPPPSPEDPSPHHPSIPSYLRDVFEDACLIDKALLTEATTCVLRCERVCGSRLVLASTGPLSVYDDVRSVGEAACRGVERALAAGARRPALVAQRWAAWARAPLVALLAALHALYAPLHVREQDGPRAARAHALAVLPDGLPGHVADLIRDAVAVETARVLCRDIGGADPERMTPLNVAEYVRAAFPPGSAVSVRVLSDADAIRRQYPLFALVTRAADTVPRHKGCIVFLEYVPESYDKTVLLVGKGVTYDTGGCDIKTGGAMAGMSRDKCGAAAVAGFFKACEALGARVKAVGALALVRNSVGADAYVADEVVASRAGLRVRIGNTDAEGRLVMADLLAEMRERARSEASPWVVSVATLTGHARLALGPYGAALDNAGAREAAVSAALAAHADALGDALLESRVRREDAAAHRGRGEGDALLQAAPRPSSAVPRGHQGPAAFLQLASGLSRAPPYTHLDVAGSAGDPPAHPTASPLLPLLSYLGLLHYHPDE